MEHQRGGIEIPGRGEKATPMGEVGNPQTDPAAEYFERYEKKRGGEESIEESNMEYWLSEEEEEGHQLKRRKWKSRVKREPYVVQDAKAPKLRPAEGI